LSVTATATTRFTAYGNPGSIGEPSGLFAGEINATGDASGGTVTADFGTNESERLQFVWFFDGVDVIANTNPGRVSREILTHWARANSAIGQRFAHRKNVPTATDGAVFYPTEDLMSDYITRTPVFWDTQELAVGSTRLCTIRAATNTLATSYEFRIYGRYYDKQILNNRGFGRLVSPAAVSQFEG